MKKRHRVMWMVLALLTTGCGGGGSAGAGGSGTAGAVSGVELPSQVSAVTAN